MAVHSAWSDAVAEQTPLESRLGESCCAVITQMDDFRVQLTRSDGNFSIQGDKMVS